MSSTRGQRAEPGKPHETPALLKPLAFLNDATGLHAKYHSDCPIGGGCQQLTLFDNNPAKAADRLSYAIPVGGELKLGAKGLFEAGKAVVEAGGRKEAAKAGTEAERTLVIGRTKDLTAPGALQKNEYTLLDRLTPDLGSPRANWKRNSSVLRQELRNGTTRIRDASPGDTSGSFLNAERNLLGNRGWPFDARTSQWGAP